MVLNNAKEAAMDGLSACYMLSSAEVIVEATTKWCECTQSEPDQLLMTQAITLFNRGYDTTEGLFNALRQNLMQ